MGHAAGTGAFTLSLVLAAVPNGRGEICRRRMGFDDVWNWFRIIVRRCRQKLCDTVSTLQFAHAGSYGATSMSKTIHWSPGSVERVVHSSIGFRRNPKRFLRRQTARISPWQISVPLIEV